MEALGNFKSVNHAVNRSKGLSYLDVANICFSFSFFGDSRPRAWRTASFNSSPFVSHFNSVEKLASSSIASIGVWLLSCLRFLVLESCKVLTYLHQEVLFLLWDRRPTGLLQKHSRQLTGYVVFLSSREESNHQPLLSHLGISFGSLGSSWTMIKNIQLRFFFGHFNIFLLMGWLLWLL